MHRRLITFLRIIRRSFVLNRRGAVAIIFAVSALTLVLAVGAGTDLQRAYTARQQLSAVATFTCQYANRPTVVSLAFGSGGTTAYTASVNSYYALALADQNAGWTQTTATPFTYTQGGAGNVTLTATVATSIIQIIGIKTLPVGVSAQCFAVLASTPQQPVADATATMLINEGFENAGHDPITWYLPTGTYAGYDGLGSISATSTALTHPGYVGSNGNEWIIMGYCLEVDYVGKTQTTVPQGTHGAELDCDNGSQTAGNSSISTKVYLAVGSYELRWDYAARIANTYYQTSYICGTTAADTSWATDTSYSGGYGAQTNQVNVYLDQNTTGSPPTHTTLYGSQTLAGSNLIDECVYSDGWLERSVLITVTTAGYYWLSLAADGANDSFGGDIDNIRLCASTCSGSVADNFPPSWLPASNGGNNAVLFEDTFESPNYTNMGAQNNQWYYNSGNMGQSTGSSAFWGESGKGWGDAPTNQMSYWETGCPQGTQCIQFGSNSPGDNNVNNLVSRPFLLDPGYYQISYDYISEVVFATDPSGNYCGTTPAGVGLPTSNSSAGTYRQIPGYGPSGTPVHDTNAVGLFMSHAQMASTPNPSTTFQNTTYYTNPDGTTTTTPAVPPNAVNLTNYTVSTTSPLLDICGYATSAQARTRNVLILKAAFYWLTFSALGTADGAGGEIDDVKITALGSPYMTGAPSSPVTIPVPGPQPGSTLSFTGFSITTGGEY